MTEPPEEDDTPPRRGALIALLLVAALAMGGLWLAQHLAAVSRLQDCVMSGRTNCAPLQTGK
jgi:hypothetical protein